MAEINQRDLVLRPGEYALVSDETKGKVEVHVGPYKSSLASTDRPVKFDGKNGRFKSVNLDDAIEPFIDAPKGHYVVLKNPAKDNKQPEPGGSRTLPELEYGQKVNISGPCHFPLWPGQSASIVEGHHLRSNQYLLVRVYDEDTARANFDKNAGNVYGIEADDGTEEAATKKKTGITKDDLTTGKLLIVKGTECGFYIPPTGFEVIPETSDYRYVRNAVTLERLEYCVLLDESGNKRYVRGPAVVFPAPTEQFLTRETKSASGNPSKSRKFRAIELNENSGLYIKVIASYEEDGVSHKEGDELFITGKDQMIYFPRTEHSLISYGDQEIIYAVAIPEGEARYVMNRNTGAITLVQGPTMLLPDPRNEVIVRRILDPKLVKLLYPGNTLALEYNMSLAGMQKSSSDTITDAVFYANALAAGPKGPEGMVGASGSRGVEGMYSRTTLGESANPFKKFDARASSDLVVDDIPEKSVRKKEHTPPRSIVIDARFDGAVKIKIWTGYAILVVNGKGERKVVEGPTVYHLAYDEFIETFRLSTGQPKSNDRQIEDVFLRVKNNKISDLIDAETKDFVKVQVKVSHRVNFEGDSSKWFDVEDYVKFLCDHVRSIVRATVKRTTIQDFSADYINIVRDAILGPKTTGEKRTGRLFEENGCRIYDVEILKLTIGDNDVSRMLEEAQYNSIKQAVQLSTSLQKLESDKQVAQIVREAAQLEAETAVAKAEATKIAKAAEMAIVELNQKIALEKLENEHELASTRLENELELDAAREEAERETEQKNLDFEKNKQELLDAVASADLARKKAIAEFQEDQDKAKLERQLEVINTKAKAEVERLKAIQPELIASMQALAQTTIVKDIAPQLAPMALVKGTSAVGVLTELFENTSFKNVLDGLKNIGLPTAE